MQIGRSFSSKLVAAFASLVIPACLMFSAWPVDAARGLSTASVNAPVSNTARKGDRLTSTHSNVSASTVARGELVTAKPTGKIPDGCETAFSKLDKRADLSSSRCIT